MTYWHCRTGRSFNAHHLAAIWRDRLATLRHTRLALFADSLPSLHTAISAGCPFERRRLLSKVWNLSMRASKASQRQLTKHRRWPIDYRNRFRHQQRSEVLSKRCPKKRLFYFKVRSMCLHFDKVEVSKIDAFGCPRSTEPTLSNLPVFLCKMFHIDNLSPATRNSLPGFMFTIGWTFAYLTVGNTILLKRKHPATRLPCIMQCQANRPHFDTLLPLCPSGLWSHCLLCHWAVGFGWSSCESGGWYKIVQENVPAIKASYLCSKLSWKTEVSTSQHETVFKSIWDFVSYLHLTKRFTWSYDIWQPKI